MSQSIVCFGEALIDFLNTDKQQHGEQSLNHYVQFPGGAPANVAVAASKLGSDVRFVGQVGDDPFGQFLIQSLAQYDVDTQFTLCHPSAKTALAFVMLDDEGDRSFSFYRDKTADLVLTPQQLTKEMFKNCGVFHFCSNTLVDEAISNTTLAALSMAKLEKSVISFDVNLRHNLWPNLHCDVLQINEFVMYSDIVKFSRDEFEYLAQGHEKGFLRQCFKSGVSLILVTDGGEAVEVMTEAQSFHVAIPETKVVDTTAGGDGFSGGLIYGVNLLGLSTLLNDVEQLKRVVSFAVACGAIAVSKQGAFPSLPTLSDIDTSWRI